MDAKKFWSWFEKQAPDLEKQEPEARGAALNERLAELGSAIQVEVILYEEGPTEIVFTADGDVELFPEIHALVAAAPSRDGWSFVALRPPQGFEFNLDLDGEGVISADTLTFEPLESPQMPGAIGLRVFVEPELAEREDLGDVLWTLLETGIGEERLAQIMHIEVAPKDAAQEPVPITVLPVFLEQRAKRLAAEQG